MNLKNGNTAVLIGITDCNLPVKTSWTHQSRIKYIAAVCSCHDDDSLIHGKSVHFDEKLVKCLFTFIVTSSKPSSPMASHSIDFVYKHNSRCNLFCLIKQVPYAACPNADKHLHKIAAADGEKRNAGFSCYCFRQECFTCSGRADKQNPFGDPGAKFRIVSRILQKIHHFLKFFLLFVCACHIGKCDLVFRRILHSGAAFTEIHYFSAPASLRANHHEPYYSHDDQHNQIWKKIIPPRYDNRCTIFKFKGKLIDCDLFKSHTLLVSLDLAYGIKKIVANRCFKIIVPVRKIIPEYGGGISQADKRIIANCNPRNFATLNHIKQLRIFNSPACSLIQAAVEQNRDKKQC